MNLSLFRVVFWATSLFLFPSIKRLKALPVSLYLICHLIIQIHIFMLSLSDLMGLLNRKDLSQSPWNSRWFFSPLAFPRDQWCCLPGMWYRIDALYQIWQKNWHLKHLPSPSGNTDNAFGKHVGTPCCCPFLAKSILELGSVLQNVNFI